MSTQVLLPLPVFLPLSAAALLAAGRKWLSRAAVDSAAIAVAAAQVVITSVLLHASFRGATVYWFGGWTPRGSMAIGISFVLDPAGALLAAFAAVLMLLALLFSWRVPDCGEGHLQPLMLIFLAAMSGFVLTGDIFNLFVWFELMSTAAFALCGLDAKEAAPLQGAFNFAITNTVAAFMVLTGIAVLYALTGALNLAQIGLALGARHDAPVLLAFALILCGFLTKSAIVPFHFWLADAHAVSPTAVCVMFSGLMVELGLYAIARLKAVVFGAALLPHAHAVQALLLTLGCATVLLGGFMCYAEHHLKRVLAFSTVCHAGLMLLAVALNTPAALAALLLYVLAHGLVKASMFFCAGNLLHHSRSMSEPLLFGRGRGLPLLGVLWFGGALGLAGFPLFATAAGEAIFGQAAEAAHLSWLPWAYVLGGAITAAAPLRIGMHTFLGWGSKPISDRSAKVDEQPEDQRQNERPITLWLPPLIALAGSVVLRWPGVAERIIVAAASLADGAGYVREVYSASNGPVSLPVLRSMSPDALRHGVLAAVLATLLACTSVFRSRLPRRLRIGAAMEGGLQPLRALQSGLFTDYVLWLTLGFSAIGAFCMLAMR